MSMGHSITASLDYFDFYSIAVQHTTLQAVLNCCQNVPPEHFQLEMICSMCPIICICLAIQINALSSLHAFALIAVLSASLTLTPCWWVTFNHTFMLDTFTQLLHALATAVHASPNIMIVLWKQALLTCS
jgi:E3 ubiquitin-protein ligase TRIP12